MAVMISSQRAVRFPAGKPTARSAGL